MSVDVKPKVQTKNKPSSSTNGAEDLPKDVQTAYDKCLAKASPVSQSEFASFMPANRRDADTVSDAINTLLNKHLLELLHYNNALAYRAIAQNEARRVGSMEGDEAMIYGYIKNSGNEGIWSRHIKARTNLHATVITRNLKALEGKSLIKCVRSVQHPTRKIYMLYDLTPSIEVSGGPWFTDSELDVDFVQILSEAIEKYIGSRSKPKSSDYEKIYPPSHTHFPTVQDIHSWLRTTDLTQVDLAIGDIHALLNVLIYDGKIERRGDGLTYKTVARLIDNERHNAFTEMPCGQCPVFNLCQEGGVVSPEGCVYWGNWLTQNGL